MGIHSTVPAKSSWSFEITSCSVIRILFGEKMNTGAVESKAGGFALMGNPPDRNYLDIGVGISAGLNRRPTIPRL